MLKLIDMMHIAIFTALMAVLGFMPSLLILYTCSDYIANAWCHVGRQHPQAKVCFLKPACLFAARRLRSAAVARRTRRFWCVFRTERRLFDCLSPRFMADQFSR